MVNRASRSMLKLKSVCQILGLEVVVSSLNSSSIEIISCSGPSLFLSLWLRFIYLCKQELTRKPFFFSNFLRYESFFSKVPNIQCLSVPQCHATSCHVPRDLPIHLLNRSGNVRPLGAVYLYYLRPEKQSTSHYRLA